MTEPQPQKHSSPTALLIAAAVVLLVVGLAAGGLGVSAGSGPQEVSCGSYFSPSDREASIQDGASTVAGTLAGADSYRGDLVAECDDARSSRQVIVLGAIALAVIVGAVGIATSRRS